MAGTGISDFSSVGFDAGSRLRVSQLTTLADLKTLNADNTELFNTQGTGTGTYGSNKFNMAVTSGQFLVRASKRFYPYFSGKSQQIECTFDGFNLEANVTKRVGYFSSNAVSPFNNNLDGFYLENNGTDIRLIVSRNGTQTLNVISTSWSGAAQVAGYNWANFTVVLFDFLWLGGAVLRMFVKIGNEFVLAHQFDYAGTSADTFTLSPNQQVRYEIRSSTGTGSFRAICAQVSTEGSVDEAGLQGSINTGATVISANTIGTKYPIKGIRKKVAFRDNAIKITSASLFINSADQALLTLELNPILSAPLTYTDIANTAIQQSNGNGTITVTTQGQILYSQVITQNSVIDNQLEFEFYSFLGQTLDNVMDQIVLCITPITATVSVFGTMTYKQY